MTTTGTKTRTISKTVINKILNNGHKDFYRNILVVDDYCYLISGVQMVRCDRSLIDVSDTDIKMIDIMNYDGKGKQTVFDLIESFETFVKNNEKESTCYPIIKSLLKETIAEKQKEIKELGGKPRATSISLMFKETKVNARFLLELLQLSKEKTINVLVNDDKPLSPITVLDNTDEIISILMPLRADNEITRINIDNVWR